MQAGIPNGFSKENQINNFDLLQMQIFDMNTFNEINKHKLHDFSFELNPIEIRELADLKLIQSTEETIKLAEFCFDSNCAGIIIDYVLNVLRFAKQYRLMKIVTEDAKKKLDAANKLYKKIKEQNIKEYMSNNLKLSYDNLK